MKTISSFTPFTMVDYPGKIACVIWFSGCNMRCKYCYNVKAVLDQGTTSVDDIKAFLSDRKGILDGVVLSGGESTLNIHFKELLDYAYDLGYSIKVDSNGSNLDVLKASIDKIDYLAIDFKSTKDKYKDITNSNLYDKTIETIKYLISIDKPFEVRTTIHTSLLNEDDINSMIKVLESIGYNNTYYLQKYQYIGPTIGNLEDEVKDLDKSKIHSNIKVEYRNFK